MGVVGAVSIAAAIAFGWGGHGVAEELVRKWYGKGKAAAPKIASAADEAAEKLDSQAPRQR
jgi:hypothetical protein